MDWQPWLKLLHIAAGFTFAMAHGVSAFTVIRLRGERDPARVAALLDLSKFSLPISDLAILVILISGIASAFVLGYWGHLWIWVSIGVLVFLFISMSVRGVQHYDAIRHALGTAGFYDKKNAPIPEADPEALASALASARGMELAAVGGIGLLVILWLMVLKPF
jgi:phosphoglycerol transferase MdoB-like AlkP superfamily enzyme